MKRVRTVVLAAVIGALVGLIAGPEHPEQRFIIVGLAAGVGFVTGIFLVLIPPKRPTDTREDDA